MHSIISRTVFAMAVAAALVGGAARLWAEPAPASLTVDQAVAAALRNNLTVKAATTEERAKKAASDLSFNKLYPSVAVSGSVVQLNQPTPVLVPTMTGGVAVFTPSATNLALNMSIQEVFSPTCFVLMKEAALDYSNSSIDRTQAQRQIAAAVKKAFYQLQVQKETITLTRSRLEKARERLRQAQVSYQLGQSPELNYVYANENVEGIIPALRSLETAYQAALTQFEQILGFDTRLDMELAGSLDIGNATSDRWSGRESERLDVRKARVNVQQIETGLSAENTVLLPTIILQYTADPVLNNPASNSIWKGSNWMQSTGGLYLTLSWDLSPLLPGSDYWVKLGEYNDRLALARDVAADAMRKALDDTNDQRRAITASMDNIDNLQRSLESARRAYELTDISYKAGAGRLLDLQDAELSWQSAQVQLLNEKLKLVSLIYDWDAKYEPAQ
jgi:outer membrane protein TolC